MSDGSPYFLDTNVIVATLETHDARRQQRALELVAVEDVRKVTSSLVLVEVFAALTRKLSLPFGAPRGVRPARR